LVVQFLRALEDALSGFFGDIRVVSERFRDGDYSEAQILRQIFQADIHSGHYIDSSGAIGGDNRNTPETIVANDYKQ
jgi:hypothetical protein